MAVLVGHIRYALRMMRGSPGFAAIALAALALGIGASVDGLMPVSHTRTMVERRTQEIGIRVALGAERRDVLRMIVLGGLKLAGIGVAAGLAVAYGVTRLLGALLFGVKAADPPTFAAVALAVAGIALVAAYVPARRAAGIEAADALRHQ